MSLESENKYSSQNEKLPPKVQIDTKELLNDLAKKIAKEYGIDVSEVKKLINSKTETKLGTLKNLVSTGNQVIDTQALQSVIKGAKDVVEKASKEEIQVLKGALEKNEIATKDDFYITTKLIPKGMYERAKNPQNLGDNLVGASIGVINSLEATIQLLYDIGSGIIKAPYHIYLVASGKGEYKKIKKI